jgi:hypothetical protein
MSYPKLKYKNGDSRVFQLSNGDEVKLVLDGEIIYFYDSNGNQLEGEFVFQDEMEEGREFLLSRMYAPKQYKRQGLGTEAVKMFIEIFGVEVYVRENDGSTREDGSHLTEDAPAFVEKLMNLGLLRDTRDRGY